MLAAGPMPDPSAGDEEPSGLSDALQRRRLALDRRLGAVAGQDAHRWRDLPRQARERGAHLLIIAAGKIGPAIAAGEQDVAGQEDAVPLVEQTDGTLGVPRR